MPTVSVIIPTYNRGSLLLQTLESVFQQTYKDFEVIVVNDGSRDNTGEILRALVANGSIRYVEQANQGLSCARNTGASMAVGEYLAFVDDDDLWPLDKLEWQVRSLDRNTQAAMVYGFSKSFENLFTAEKAARPLEPKGGPSGDCRRAFLEANFMSSIGQTLIRRSAFEKVGRFESGRLYAEDCDLYIRLSKIAPFIYEERLALHYRMHSNPRISNNLWKQYRGLCSMRTKHLGLFPQAETAGSWFRNFIFWRRSFSKRFFSAARVHFTAGNVKAGLKALVISIWLWPVNLLEIRFYSSLKSLLGSRISACRKSGCSHPR